MTHLSRRRILGYTLLFGSAAFLHGCVAGGGGPSAASSAEDTLDPRQARIATTARQIAVSVALTSQFRQQNGLSRVAPNGLLQKMAENQALLMARAGRVDHTIGFGNSFARRLNASGYRPRVAAENIAGGYDTIEAAMAGWEASAGHRKNLLKPGVSEIGLGLALNPTAPLKTYWAMALASPA